VEIEGDGTVHYQGDAYVAIAGSHTGKTSPEAVHMLFNSFRDDDFFWLLDSYAAPITDNPGYQVSISFDGHTKSVSDYVGRMVGMPAAVTELENLIDTTAGTKKWVTGDDETIPSLRAEGWDFHSERDENLRLLQGATERRNGMLLVNLMRAGVSAHSKYGCNALSSAANQSDLTMVRALLDAGAPVHWDVPEGNEGYTCDALETAATWGIPEIVRLILDHHPDLNFRGPEGNTDLMYAAQNAQAKPERPGQDFEQTARLLIAAGADVNAKDASGETALMKAHSNRGLVTALLRAGANRINAKDGFGRTPLMNSYDPGVTEVLLEAGADPFMADKDGKTALDIAEQDEWRKTAPILKAWLAAHPRSDSESSVPHP
jgi:ankyrin repeat protein